MLSATIRTMSLNRIEYGTVSTGRSSSPDRRASSEVTGEPPVPRPITSPLAPILASRSMKCTCAPGEDPIPVPLLSSSSPGPR